MQPRTLSLDDYMANLGRQSSLPDPTEVSPDGLVLKSAAADLAQLASVDRGTLQALIEAHPRYVEALGYAVGLTREKLQNNLRHRLGSSGFVTLAQRRGKELIEYLDQEFGLVPLVRSQLAREYDFGDVLVARAGTRALAKSATVAGRSLEDEIEDTVKHLGLPYLLRGTFTGLRGLTAPYDLAVVDDDEEPVIVVAAKAFDSTGSKLTDAVREIDQMATARQPTQFVMAVVDGIGWHRRRADLARIYNYWQNKAIDGLYTRATLGAFQGDLLEAARRLDLL